LKCHGIENTTTEVAETSPEASSGAPEASASPTNLTTTPSPPQHSRHERAAVVTPGQWTLLHRGKLVVEPTRLVSVFTIPGDYRMHARYNITFVVPEARPGCLPNETLRYCFWKHTYDMIVIGTLLLRTSRSCALNETGWESALYLDRMDSNPPRIWPGR